MSQVMTAFPWWSPQAAQIYTPESQFFVFSVDSLSTPVTRINFPLAEGSQGKFFWANAMEKSHSENSEVIAPGWEAS